MENAKIFNVNAKSLETWTDFLMRTSAYKDKCRKDASALLMYNKEPGVPATLLRETVRASPRTEAQADELNRQYAADAGFVDPEARVTATTDALHSDDEGEMVMRDAEMIMNPAIAADIPRTLQVRRR